MAQQKKPKDLDELQSFLGEKAWADETYLKRLREDPKEVVAKEMGINIPDNVKVILKENTGDDLWIAIPPNLENLSDEQLELVSGGAGGSIVAWLMRKLGKGGSSKKSTFGALTKNR